MRYLLITHIPFARQGSDALLDRLWAEDLKGLAAAMGPVTVAAPEYTDAAKMQGWGAGFATLAPGSGVSFVGLPMRGGRLDLSHSTRLRGKLRQAVDQADLVHTSNLFEPNTGLYFAHDYATRQGKKTLFVVAEDFYDMLDWEWVRTAPNALQHWRRQRTLERLNRHVRARVATASLTFLHTPAAVARYRSYARNAVSIRQPVHEREDVISESDFAAKLAVIHSGVPLQIVTASRLQPLKGLDMLLRAISILAQRGIHVEARLYGSGPQLDSLTGLANHLGIASSVSFPGALSPASAVRAALAQGHVFLMPHLTSDFGRAFFDAIAAACPVVAFRSIASQDTVRDTVDGLLAPNADPEALAAALTLLHTDRALLARLATAARERALSNTKAFWSEYRAGMIRELFPTA